MTNLERWRFYLKDYESPDSFIDWGFYSMIGSALQRRVWYNSEDEHRLFANQFVLFVGPPGCGKTRIIRVVKTLLEASLLSYEKGGRQYGFFTVAPDSLTWQRLPDFLLDNASEAVILKPDGSKEFFKIDYIDAKGKRSKKLYIHSSISFINEDLSILINEDTRQVINVLTQLYDSGDFYYSTKEGNREKKGQERVKNVCTNLLSGIYPDFFKSRVVDATVESGLMSRTICVYGGKKRFFRIFPGLNDEQIEAKQKLLEHLKALYYLAGQVQLTPEAEAFERETYESGKLVAAKVTADRRLERYFERKYIHWKKLAIIVHFADQLKSMVIEKSTMEKALQELNKLEASMHLTFASVGRNPIYDLSMEILDHLKKAPRGLVWKQIWFKMGREGAKQELSEAWEWLQATSQVQEIGGTYFPAEISEETLTPAPDLDL